MGAENYNQKDDHKYSGQF